MKLFLALVAVAVLFTYRNAEAKTSKYPWTQWLALHPQPVGASAHAVAMAPQLQQAAPFYSSATSNGESQSQESQEEEAEAPEVTWMKRAVKEELTPMIAAPTIKPTKKPLIEVPVDFWAPQTTSIPDPLIEGATQIIPVPPPPGYYAAKKSMFISKLFSALAKVVLANVTTPAPPTPSESLMASIDNVLLSAYPRSLPIAEEMEDKPVKPMKIKPAPTTPTLPPAKKQKAMLAKMKDTLKKSKKVKTTTENSMVDYEMLAKALLVD